MALSRWRRTLLIITIKIIGDIYFALRRHSRGTPGLAGAKSILVIRLDGIGDFVLASSFLKELRKLSPNAHITLVVQPLLYNLGEFCPYVNEVIETRCSTLDSASSFRQLTETIRLVRRRFRGRQFDLAVVPRWDADVLAAPLIAYLSGAKRRVGYSECVNELKKVRNARFDYLLTDPIRETLSAHELERNLDILGFMGACGMDKSLELWIGEADGIYADATLKDRKITGDQVVALAPFVGEAKRQWPVANFIEVGKCLIEKYGFQVMLVGEHGTEKPVRELVDELGEKAFSVTGVTLRELGALLKRATLFIGNDSGPMHIAAATGTPVIEISCHPHTGTPGHTNAPERFGPRGTPCEIIRPDRPLAPCRDGCSAEEAHCITQIDVAKVFEAAEFLLEKRTEESRN